MRSSGRRSKSTANYQRLKRQLRRLLQSHLWELDFGLFRTINRNRGEIEQYLDTDLPRMVQERTDILSEAADVFDFLAKFAGECADTDIPVHIHCTSPLPEYAFLLRSGRRVVFERQAASPLDSLANGDGKSSRDSAPHRFLISDRNPWSLNRNELRLLFEFRPVPPPARQKTLNEAACSKILDSKKLVAWRAELAEPHAESRESCLSFHLAQFSSWHKHDLVIREPVTGEYERLLERMILEHWLAPGVWSNASADRIAQAGEIARLVREIGRRLIAWLTDREQALHQLWQCPPQVAAAEYCATIDRVPRALWAEIAANSAQQLAWRELFGVGAPTADGVEDFFGSNPFLVVDTRHFDESFRDHLLASFEHLDEATDGLLIHADNHAALRLLMPRYSNSIRCVFIDPPYNTGSGVWDYADRFQHVLWEAMMRDRLILARELLSQEGAIFISLDDHEQARLRLLLDDVCGEQNFLATIVWEKVHTRKNSARHFSVSHDYIPAFAKNKERWQRQLLPRESTSGYQNPDGDPRGPWKPDPIYANKPYAATYQVRKPNGVMLNPPPGRYWRFSEANLWAKAEREEILWGQDDAYPLAKRYLDDVQAGLVPVTLFTREFAGDNALANAELVALFGSGRQVSYPKPSKLIERIGQIATEPKGSDVVLDFFAGSGTTGQAVINLNRADGGRRKYILVEKGAYFDSVLVPRIAKSIYCNQWQAGRPLPGQGSSQLFKYLRLETFEEALCRSGTDDSANGTRRVDLLETLIFRLGLRVEKRQRIKECLAIRGRAPSGENVFVLWTEQHPARPANLLAKLKSAGIFTAEVKFAKIYVRDPKRWPEQETKSLANEICDLNEVLAG